MKKLVVLFAFVTLFVAACGSESSYETIEIDTIPQKIEEGYQVLDVREPSEYDMGHIVGAENKPLSELKAGNFEGLDSSEKYVVICQSGNRSKEASEILTGEEFSILNVSKGMSSWTGEIE